MDHSFSVACLNNSELKGHGFPVPQDVQNLPGFSPEGTRPFKVTTSLTGAKSALDGFVSGHDFSCADNPFTLVITSGL